MFHFLKKTSFVVLIALSAVGFSLSHANAQAMAPAGAIADVPTFQIQDGWTVEKTPLSQAMKFKDMRLPCVMTASYDNGFTLRFSGGGGKIMALAVDFRQEIFRQGRKYQTLLTTDVGQYNVQATAFSENVLLFKIDDTNGFYQSIMRDAPLIVDVEGNTFRFVMSGILEGMTKLEQCYDPAGEPVIPFPVAGPMPPMDAPVEPGSPMDVATAPIPQPAGVPMLPQGQPMPITPDLAPAPVMPAPAPTAPLAEGAPIVAPPPLAPAPMSEAVPMATGPVVSSVQPVKDYPEWGSRVAKAAPHDRRDERAVNAKGNNILPTKQMDMPIQEMVWNAKDGDSVEATIRRWSERANVDVAWQAGPPVPVLGDFEFRGTFNEAVQTLIAQNATTMGFVAQMDGVALPPAMPIAGPVPNGVVSPTGALVSAPNVAPIAPASLPRVSRAMPLEPNMRPQPIVPMAGPVAALPPAPITGTLPPPPPEVEYVPFKWSAPSGASLQGVLEFWSKQAGIDFVWKSNQNFELKRGINNTQSYESALQSVLEQFASEGIYPTAQLNKDPKTGKQTLFVFSARNG